MLTMWGTKQKFCDGINRRSFLKIGAFGAGLSLADMLRLRAAGSAAGSPSPSQKSAIMIYLAGGPSHIDMYDLKPDAPDEYRGEFKPIPTNVPGIQICEHLPRLAGHADKLAIIRSMTHNDVDHTSSTHFLLTGRGVPRRVHLLDGGLAALAQNNQDAPVKQRGRPVALRIAERDRNAVVALGHFDGKEERRLVRRDKAIALRIGPAPRDVDGLRSEIETVAFFR